MDLLKFSVANTKTKRLYDIPSAAQYLTGKRKVYSLDLSAGWSCPGAEDCYSRVVLGQDGELSVKDGLGTPFRCFAVSQEVLYPTVYQARRYNFTLLRQAKSKHSLLYHSLPRNAGIIRYHVSGDFFDQDYMQTAINIAKLRPDILFYGYTKSLHFLWKLRKQCEDLSLGIIQENFLITASYGGKYDRYIPKLGIRTAKVIFDEYEAMGLPIDHDDSHAATPGDDFCLLLHGVQPKSSAASKALVELRGVGSYNRKVSV